MAKKITKDMLISELVEEHPDAVPVLFEAGFHCLGCAMASQETIGQGAEVHGMDPKELVKKLNEAEKKAKK